MSNEENKALVRRFFEECWNAGNLALVDQLVAPAMASHDSANPGFQGAGGMKRLIALYRGAFPDLHFTLEDLIAEGEMVTARWTAIGTHQHDFQGIPPTGKRASVPGITTYRLAGGKIEEGWNQYDVLGMMQQLGLLPLPGLALPLEQPGLETPPL